MALFHAATLTPTKSELIAAWAPTQPWGLPAEVPVKVIGSYRFDDPDGRVGMLPIKAEIRQAIGKGEGDTVTVRIEERLSN